LAATQGSTQRIPVWGLHRAAIRALAHTQQLRALAHGERAAAGLRCGHATAGHRFNNPHTKGFSMNIPIPALCMRRNFHKVVLITAMALTLALPGLQAQAATAEDLKQDAAQTLQQLYKAHPEAELLSKNAKALLVFPKIIKAGLVFGGSYGEGVMTREGQSASYYNSVSASWGWQAGAESYAYVVFLMNDKALQYLEKSKGWEFGVGPTVVVVNEGVAKNLTTSTLKNDAYAYILDQQGLMASLSIEGTKISPIQKR
jgi:lipid-binding SYLF domain-containing protein